jgi:hypothetical protein
VAASAAEPWADEELQRAHTQAHSAALRSPIMAVRSPIIQAHTPIMALRSPIMEASTQTAIPARCVAQNRSRANTSHSNVLRRHRHSGWPAQTIITIITIMVTIDANRATATISIKMALPAPLPLSQTPI